MPRIRELPEEVARCIAAGEVVERPASIVKELIENAVDAGARNITLNCRRAGKELIEVADDGCGMSPQDVDLAFRNFSTSKITDAEDLFNISTYGFRGEALASIAAVSQTTITSSDQTQGEGMMKVKAGKRLTSRPAPREKGTTVAVQDLFFNTPARRKFLKSDLSERRKILEAFLSFGLILPDIEFHYLDDGEHVIDLPPAVSWRERVAAILGANTMEHMVEVNSTGGPLRIQGFASLPTYTRGNRANQFIYINKRHVKEKTMMHAARHAYRNVIPAKRFPVLILAVEIPYEDVDVNVHPRKLEVRIKNERFAHEAVRGALKSALSGRAEAGIEVSYKGSMRDGVDGAVDDSHQKGKAHPQPGGSPPQAPAYGDLKVIALKQRIQDATAGYINRNPGTVDPNPQLSLRTEDFVKRGRDRETTWQERFLGEESLFWQFNNAYIFIDQHAAHERVIFDTSKKQIADEIQVSQQILFPIHLELSLSELEIYRASKEIFQKIGFDIEPFGGKSILVRGYPQGLKNWNEGQLLLQIFDDLLHDSVPGETHTDKILASFACRSAVKAGKKLSVEEMRLLADQLFASENPYSCPHGRPTIQRLSLDELERWFQRR
jgi:DNA mismatch repair protein MutL